MRVIESNGFYELRIKKNGEWKTVFVGTMQECMEEISNVKLD
ncbi:MAG: hypothetical protein ACRC6B_04530 [Fusobacteriaceae bacterium]